MMEPLLTKIYNAIHYNNSCLYCNSKYLIKFGSFGYNQLWYVEKFTCENCNNFVADIALETRDSPSTIVFSCKDLIVCIYPSSKVFVAKLKDFSSEDALTDLELYEEDSQLNFIPDFNFADQQKLYHRLKSALIFS